jgi:hypothetical protein
MQMTDCVEDFLVVKYTVQECNKFQTGVEGLFYLRVFTSVDELLRSDKAISVHNRETENIFEPILNQITKQIISTFLEEFQVTSLTTIQTIKNWNWDESKGDYITILGAVIGTLLVLIMVIVLICKRGIFRICFKRDPIEEIEIQRRQQNYRLNRLAMKK